MFSETLYLGQYYKIIKPQRPQSRTTCVFETRSSIMHTEQNTATSSLSCSRSSNVTEDEYQIRTLHSIIKNIFCAW